MVAVPIVLQYPTAGAEAAAVVAQLSGEMTGADSASLIRAALKKMAPKT